MSSARTSFKNIYASGNAGINGTLEVGGNTTLDSDLLVRGATTLNNTTTMNSDVNCTGTITSAFVVVTGDLALQGTSLLPFNVVNDFITMSGTDGSSNPVLVEGSVSGQLSGQVSVGDPAAGGLGKIASVFISGMSGTIYSTASVASLDLNANSIAGTGELSPNNLPSIPILVTNGSHVVPGVLNMTAEKWTISPVWNGTANSDVWAANATAGILPTSFSYFLDKSAQ